MVIIVKDGTKEERIRDLIQWIESQNLRTHVSTGDYSTIIGVIGDTSKLDEDLISGLDIVEGVKRVSEPFKSANRKFHPDDTVITLPGGQKVKFWEDGRVYLGNQLEKQDGSCRCYGLTADENWLLVCEYGDNGSDPELVVYKRREK